MPNTPALVGESATAFALGRSASSGDAQLAMEVVLRRRIAFQVKESLLDAVTGLSGSGPAYVYLFIEALSDGAWRQGCSRGGYQIGSTNSPGERKNGVGNRRTPWRSQGHGHQSGRHDDRGLHELEKGKLRGTLMSAVRAATEKSRKLGQG